MIALLLASPAQAWNHLGTMWGPDSMPISFYMTDYKEDSLPQVEGDNGLLYQEEVMVKGYCNWHWTEYCDEVLSIDAFGFIEYPTAECADIRFEYKGINPGNEGSQNNGTHKVYWDDPSGNMGAGINAWTITRPTNEVVKSQGGRLYYQVNDSDIEFNDDIDWSTDAEIADGCQGDERSVESTGTHEIGHLLGMAHSCEQGELCTSESFLKATMYWTGGSCDTSRSGINEDDIEGINALYGPYMDWTTEGERTGPAPLELSFFLDANDDVIDQVTWIDWNFGDGEHSDQLEPVHVYERQGQFSITMAAKGEGEGCGEWSVSQTERAYVLVCEAPNPSFDVEHFDGLVYQVINTTDVSTYGCVDGIEWQVFKGTDTSGEPLEVIGAWSPKIDFSEHGEGEYTVVLTAQGPASEEGVQAELTFDVESRRAAGSCSTTTGGAGGLGGLALLLLGLVRRRRS